jgi:hypothetical protein
MSNNTNNQESVISVSIIDYIGRMEDGVGLLLSVMIFDELYEIAYWFNREGKVSFVPEEKLLKRLGVDSIYDYEKVEDLIMVVHANIPNVDKILDEFIK